MNEKKAQSFHELSLTTRVIDKLQTLPQILPDYIETDSFAGRQQMK